MCRDEAPTFATLLLLVRLPIDGDYSISFNKPLRELSRRLYKAKNKMTSRRGKENGRK